MSTYTIVRETLHSTIIRACRKQKSFELSFKTGSVSDGLNNEYDQVNFHAARAGKKPRFFGNFFRFLGFFLGFLGFNVQ